MKLSNKTIIIASILSLSISIAGCSNNNIQDDLQKDKDVGAGEEKIISKKISGETSRENLLKIKDKLFSGGELNNFKGKIVNTAPYIPEDKNFPPTTIYTVEMISTTSKETNETIELNGIEVLIDITNISGKQMTYKIGDEFEYSKQSEFDSGWYIHENQVLYVCIDRF